ncbi:16S rRNA (guanine527-N7)-methyltransferase [Spiroplasma corruscae]|uniref:Ribosomal RNA small subunit methyltransferase G n=1 Tax=Spiroplasma corruscae TaxID=216934 RepID=A0A222EQT2_9MOLU|nr:16S rRNA (guanine(527)-N(7))-methyltransferase RsmG [Spiroplasma corruscae]ASP28751.1 16S rRNA (guanine527-N7)-methyltransferase [Spiroplasma corruscae]
MRYEILKKVYKGIDSSIIDKLDIYIELLKKWNEKFNLTAILEDEQIIRKHFYDSLIFSINFKLDNQSVLDIGTGAGFPGVVLKIFYPNLKITLLESNNKKVIFLKEVIKKLELKNITIVNDRSESYSIGNKETFDIVTSRAVAQLNILLEIGVQALKINGYFIALKGKNYLEEIKNLNSQESLIGLKLETSQVVEEDGLGLRANLFYKKVRCTPIEYPRSYNKIKKRPLGE